MIGNISSLEDLLPMLMRIPGLLLGFTMHEMAHGYIAYRLGDPTAKNLGRLTLNPLKHLDPLGTIMMLFVGIGWAKPVPIDPRYFKNYKLGIALTSFAGPLVNLILAFAFTPLYMATFLLQSNAFALAAVRQIFFMCILVNISLAVFNLIPLPPLDGSKLLVPLLPDKLSAYMLHYQRIFQVVLILLLLLTNFITGILWFFINHIFTGYFNFWNLFFGFRLG